MGGGGDGQLRWESMLRSDHSLDLRAVQEGRPRKGCAVVTSIRKVDRGVGYLGHKSQRDDLHLLSDNSSPPQKVGNSHVDIIVCELSVTVSVTDQGKYPPEQ